MNTYLQKLSRIYNKHFENGYYSSIHSTPQIVWLNYCNGKGNLLTKGNYFEPYEFKAAEKIRVQLIDTFGVNDTYKQVLELKAYIALLNAKMFDTGNKTLQVRINIKNKELEQLLKETENERYLQDYMDTIFQIRKHLGINLDYQNITIFDYYSTLNTLEKWHKANQ